MQNPDLLESPFSMDKNLHPLQVHIEKTRLPLHPSFGEVILEFGGPKLGLPNPATIFVGGGPSCWEIPVIS